MAGSPGRALLAATALAAAALPATLAGAAAPDACGDTVPTESYSTTAMETTWTVPLAPCRQDRHRVDGHMSVQITRCDALGCTKSPVVRGHCTGAYTRCVVRARLRHPSLESASYSIDYDFDAVSGD